MAVALDDLIPRNVLVATLTVALLSLSIDLLPSGIEPEESQLKYAPRTIDQQQRFTAHASAISSIDTGAGVFSRLGEVLFEGEALAPEDLAVSQDGVAFTGLIDGRIVSFAADDAPLELRNFSRTGQQVDGCGELAHEPTCGRPLGLVFADSKLFARYIKRIPSPELFAGDQVLLVADAYKGLLLLDATGRKTLLFNHVEDRESRERQRVNFLNGVAVTKTGHVFVTESSRRFQRNQVVLEYLERQLTGRLLRLDPRTGEVAVVASDLGFPNGLEVLDDGKESLVMALTTQHKLVRFTPATGVLEDFAYVPSEPDNVSLETVGGRKVLVVGLATPSTGVVGFLKERVKTRKLLSLLPPWVTVALVKRSGSFAVLDAESGEVLRVFEDATGQTAFLISGARRYVDHVYVFSWFRRALIRVPVAALEEQLGRKD